MKEQNLIQEKSLYFGRQIVSSYLTVSKEKKEYVLSKQLLRSGTSIGANIEEALGGQSSKDFISKLSIAYKEARETLYWLKLIQSSGLLDESMCAELLILNIEIIKILSKILTTSKQRLSQA